MQARWVSVLFRIVNLTLAIAVIYSLRAVLTPFFVALAFVHLLEASSTYPLHFPGFRFMAKADLSAHDE
jgi:hypothetical protein